MQTTVASGLRKRLAIGVAAAALTVAHSVMAAPTAITTPNIINVAGSVQTTFSGQTFVNQGLQGVSRLDATTTKDFAGDTFGGYSSLDLNLSAWRKTATGYSGVLFSLPDRGPNGIGQVGFSDYAGRTSIFSLAFTPYTSATNLPVSTASQQQMQLTQTGGFFFKDFNGNVTTGFDPGLPGPTSFVTENGLQLPGSTVGGAAGKISLDAEGLRFLQNGTFYVSDEYGANVYYFDSTGKMQGVIQPPAALVPRVASGALSFTSQADALTGRRFNQGLEGLAITPDQNKLVTLLQSATMQDSTTNQATRTNTRLMIYDISQNKAPTTPIADYVLQLPIYTSTGNGGTPDRTAAQSELLALNDNQFLVLSRDGNGLGTANLNPVYKSVLLVDTTGATNIAGTSFETTTTPIAPNGVLTSSIVPMKQAEVVNMLNATQLGKFGFNLNNAAGQATRLTVTEKWEGMALAPVLEENAPQDFFLLIGTDNDFLSTTCKVAGQDCSQPVNSDSVIMVYRLTLPTYVDPQYLAAMKTTGPLSVELTDQSGVGVAGANSGNVLAQINAMRRVGANSAGLNAWFEGTYTNTKWNDLGAVGSNTKHDGFLGTIGAEYGFTPNVAIGLMFGYGQQDGGANSGFNVDAKGYSFGAYARGSVGGFYSALGYSRGHLDFDNISRPAAYGLTGNATTNGLGQSMFIEAGYMTDVGRFKLGPVVGLSKDIVRVDGYTETGAAGGNVTVPTHSLSSLVGTVGGEISGGFSGLTPHLRITYNHAYNDTPRALTLSLASAQAAMGTATVTLPTGNEDYVEVGAGVQGTFGKATWNLGYSAQIGTTDRFSHVVRAGVGLAF